MTAADERGDVKEVRLLADGELVATSRTFPFQSGTRRPRRPSVRRSRSWLEHQRFLTSTRGLQPRTCVSPAGETITRKRRPTRFKRWTPKL